MDYSRRSLTIQAILAFAMVMAVAWGTRYNWPDYVHVKYGFPATWGVHTLVTISGPADSWRVNLQNLILDLAIWAMLILLTPILLQVAGGRRV